MSATTAQQAPIVRQIVAEAIDESPLNRRRTWGNLAELSKSIESVGILEPMLARPSPSKPGRFELVYLEEGKTPRELAAFYGVTLPTVHGWIRACREADDDEGIGQTG